MAYWFDNDWFPGKYLDDEMCDLYALVIWKSFSEDQCETQFSCINVDNILNPEMLLNPKLYGLIDVKVVEWKGYRLSVFNQVLPGRVLTTGDNKEILSQLGEAALLKIKRQRQHLSKSG